LQHLLGDAQTVQPDRGIFLEISYRMQPEICKFISDAVYEGRLHPAPETSAYAIVAGFKRRAGLEYFPVKHEGNSSSSVEEANRIVGEIAQLRDAGVDENTII